MRDKLQFIFCILTCVFFALALIVAIAMGFTDAKMLLGKVVIGSLAGGLACVLALFGTLVPDLS